jgi:hypothetical protein
MDLIADLFQRNDKNELIQLNEYFKRLDWEKLDEVQLLGRIRRLIFSTVHQQIFRRYRTVDPALGKLIRNLKNNIKESTQVSLDQIDGEVWIYITNEYKSTAHLPIMPIEFLESYLAALIQGDFNLKNIINVFYDIFNNQNIYRNGYPLTDFAEALRSTFFRTNAIPGFENTNEKLFTKEEIQKMIRSSIEDVKSSKRNAYIENNKFDNETFDSYFQAIKDILVSNYIDNDNDKSYYEYLKKYNNKITYEEYQKSHRNHLEYLVKVTRNHLINSFKKELGIIPQEQSFATNINKKNKTRK